MITSPHMRWRFLIIPILLFFLAFSPLLAGMAAGTYAEYHGCRLHEGYPEPCIVDGVDVGKSLYTFAVLPWLTLATVPLGFSGLVLWVIVELVIVVVGRRRKSLLSENTDAFVG